MFPRLISLLSSNYLMRKCRCVFSLLLFCLICQQSYSQNPETPKNSDATTLELNKPIEREISGTQRHTYQITMSANQYAKVLVAKQGIDVVIRQVDKDGKIIAQYDSDPGNNGELIVKLTSKTAGNCWFTAEPRQKSSPNGRYHIELSELRLATEKEFAIDETTKLLTEASRLWRAGKNDEALPLTEQALAVLKKVLEADDENVSQVLLTMANIYSDMGDINKAESIYLRSLEIKEKVLGKEHISTSFVLNNLGVLYKDKGDYAKAEAFYLRALAIREKTLEPNHLLIASVLNNLAGLSKAKGDVNKAELFYKRVLEIRENALGPNHPDVATVLNNLANLYSDVAKVEPLYTRALAIREKAFGPDHPDVAQTLYNLAVLYSEAGDFAKAEPLCQRAVSIYEKILGAEHSLTSYPLNLLAGINKRIGDYAKSELLYQRSIAIKEKTQGPYHPDLAGVYASLSNLYVVKKEIDKAIAAQTQANNIYEYNLELNLMTGSEREKFYYLQTLRLNTNQTLSLNLQTAPLSPLATDLAVTAVLQRKGRVLDAMSDTLGTLRRRFNKQDQMLLDNLNDTTTKLVGFVLGGPNGLSAQEYRSNIKTFEEQRENLEGQISRLSSGFYEQTKPVRLKAIQDAIPANASLLEFAIYSPISPQTFEFSSDKSFENETIETPHYAVFIVNSQGEVKAKDIGQVNEINKMIAAYRLALHDPKRSDVQQFARQIDEKLMQPLRALLGNSTQLFISPDGELNLIPFEALVDEKGHYLVENYSFTYLTSGRDLLRMQTVRESKNKPLVIANPSFGEPPAEQIAKLVTPKRTLNKRQSITATRSLSDTYFAPLGNTATEGRLIQEIFPEAELLTGADATETAIKQTTAPKILHIATHGFFLQNDEISKDLKQSEIENPLLRSGLALAGANQRPTTGDDGILTALEASGLNLWGTKLVVLSACDTGLGEVKNGEGVYGLRRAFVLAGTESLVMSLWSVSDYVTRELMTNYYKNLKQGMGRGESLRKVQLEMLKKTNRQHPFYWASFIQSGEWANLEGRR